MTWQPSEPIVLLTRPLENLQKLSKQKAVKLVTKVLSKFEHHVRTVNGVSKENTEEKKIH